MALNLDHTIVPANDKEESVRFIAQILGLEYKGPWGHFAPFKINDTLTLDFDNRENFEGHHYALIASDEGRRRCLRKWAVFPGPRQNRPPASRKRLLLPRCERS